jgi:hypothetical protein
MSLRAALHCVMPDILRHEGVWRGVYRHVDAHAVLIDQHQATVRCEFPDAGPFAYIQHNCFTWPDGRTHEAVLPGVLRGDRLWWDVETFSGSAWQTQEGVIMLRLARRDDPGAEFFEMIVLSEDGQSRARTWQWVKAGRCVRRTLCDEERLRP